MTEAQILQKKSQERDKRANQTQQEKDESNAKRRARYVTGRKRPPLTDEQKLKRNANRREVYKNKTAEEKNRLYGDVDKAKHAYNQMMRMTKGMSPERKAQYIARGNKMKLAMSGKKGNYFDDNWLSRKWVK